MNVFRNKEGVEIGVEVIEGSAAVSHLLNHCFKPVTVRKMHKQAKASEEIFFQFNAAFGDQLPIIQHYLVHLNYARDGCHCAYCLHVDKDHLKVAEEMADQLKGWLKNNNDWNETTRIGMDLETKLPKETL